MTGGERGTLDEALRRAREDAHPPGEFLGQESFMRAGEIRALARAAGITASTTVLDLCCGVAGPGRLIARELGCDYLGVDADVDAVRIARDRAVEGRCRFAVAAVPPVPAGSFDVVLLLETIPAFRDKDALIRQVASALVDGGRFAFTLEEGGPLTPAERDAMPHADTVWPEPLDAITAALGRFEMTISHCEDLSAAHHETALALLNAFEVHADGIAGAIGRARLDDLIRSHRLWVDWLGRGRIRKFAIVAERLGTVRG